MFVSKLFEEFKGIKNSTQYFQNGWHTNTWLTSVNQVFRAWKIPTNNRQSNFYCAKLQKHKR